jgi:hypothetical protein
MKPGLFPDPSFHIKIKVPEHRDFLFGFCTANNLLLNKLKKRASDRHRRPVLTSETTKRKMSAL